MTGKNFMNAEGKPHSEEVLESLWEQMLAMPTQNIINSLKMVRKDHTLYVGIAFDMWHQGFDTQAAALLYHLKLNENKNLIQGAVGNVLRKITEEAEIDSSYVDEFSKFLTDLGFNVKPLLHEITEAMMQGTF